jgi:nicotinamide mononucleotide transporter
VIETALTPAFTAWGAPFTWLELLAFILSVAMVLANQRQWLVAWPLAMASSALYFVLFQHGQLYGEAGLQLFFIALAAWGWLQWWRGVEGQALPVRRLSRQGWLWALGTLAVTGPLLGAFLDHHTTSPLPYWDALPTAASVIATVLLGRKYIENWPFWIGINAASVALFAQRGYWLTVLLYAALIPLAAQGWRAWARSTGAR